MARTLSKAPSLADLADSFDEDKTPAEPTDLDALVTQSEEELAASSPSPEESTGSLDIEDTPEPTNVEELPTEIVFHTLVPNVIFNARQHPKGRTLRVRKGTMAFKETVNRDGVTWLAILDDPEAQERLWGVVKFAPGEAPDPRLARIAVPDFLETDEHRAEWRRSVLEAAELISRSK